MAENATIYRFAIDLSNIDDSIYESRSIHVALHPSETVERMMLRVVAYCFNFSDELAFTKGISTENEPDLWEKNLAGGIDLWIELGLPDDKRIKKAVTQSQKAILYAYGGQGVDTWWKKAEKACASFKSLSVYRLPTDEIEAHTDKVVRTMNLSCIIQDGVATLTWGDVVLDIQPELLKA